VRYFLSPRAMIFLRLLQSFSGNESSPVACHEVETSEMSGGLRHRPLKKIETCHGLNSSFPLAGGSP
jgi:hypothetical protein